MIVTERQTDRQHYSVCSIWTVLQSSLTITKWREEMMLPSVLWHC